MKRFPVLIALLLLTALSGTNSALAAQARNRLILFIAHADVPPYYIDEPGQPGKGILPDMLRAITESLDMTFTVRRLPDKRGWDMLRKGDVDVYASAREWVLEPDRFLWTEPFLVNEDVFLYPRRLHPGLPPPPGPLRQTGGRHKGIRLSRPGIPLRTGDA